MHARLRLTRSDRARRGLRPRTVAGLTATVGVALLALTATASPASAATTINLGRAAAFSVLGGSGVTNTGDSVLDQAVGVSPLTSITGFPPGHAHGAPHSNDATAIGAQADLGTAYGQAAGAASTAGAGRNLNGHTFTAGVYTASTTLLLPVGGHVTLNGRGDPTSVFIFQVGTALNVLGGTVSLIGDAQACNVFWQVGSLATIGSGTHFVGTIMALAGVTVETGATIEGRALSRTDGPVTLDDATFQSPGCDLSTPTSGSSGSGTGTPTGTGTGTPTGTGTGTGTATGTAAPTRTVRPTSTTRPTSTSTSTSKTSSKSASRSNTGSTAATSTTPAVITSTSPALAYTGTDSGHQLGLAAVLLAGGGGLVVLGRRRRHGGTHR